MTMFRRYEILVSASGLTEQDMVAMARYLAEGCEVTVKRLFLVSSVEPRDKTSGIRAEEVQKALRERFPDAEASFYKSTDIPPGIPPDVRLLFWIDDNCSEVHKRGRNCEYRTCVVAMTFAEFAKRSATGKNQASQEQGEIVERMFENLAGVTPPDAMGDDFWFYESPESLRERFLKAGFEECEEILNERV